jgi:hypothetical protein
MINYALFFNENICHLDRNLFPILNPKEPEACAFVQLGFQAYRDFKSKNAAFQLLYRNCEKAKKVSLAPLEMNHQSWKTKYQLGLFVNAFCELLSIFI